MPPEQWEALQQLMERAHEVTGPEREVFVQQIIARDPELGSELKELLACEAMASGILETPLWKDSTEMAGQTVPDSRILERIGAPRIGATIGPYKVQSKLRKGGMG